MQQQRTPGRPLALAAPPRPPQRFAQPALPVVPQQQRFAQPAPPVVPQQQQRFAQPAAGGPSEQRRPDGEPAAHPTAGQFGAVQPAFYAHKRYTGRQIKNRLHALAVRILRVKGERARAVAALLAHHLVGHKRSVSKARPARKASRRRRAHARARQPY